MNEEKQVLASQLGESVSVQASDQDLVRLVQIKAGALSNSKPVGSSPAQLGAVERFAIAVERVELAKQFGQDVAKFSDSDILEMVEIKGQISR
jgi:hypothetical protein